MTHNNSGPISHPQDHRSNLLLMVSILLISLVLGGGIVWVFCDYRYENALHRLNKETQISQACELKIDLYRDLETALMDLVTIAGRYQKEMSPYFKDRVLNMGDALISLREELNSAKQQYKVHEKKLAELENRDPKHIDLSFEFATAK